MNFEALKAADTQYVANTYARFDVALDRGVGATVYDVGGKEYIDFSSGIGVNALGFSDPGWVAAVSLQLAKLQHTSNLYYTEPCVDVARRLYERSGMKRVFFANSGAESNEGAIKCARKYSRDRYGAGRHRIVTLVNSFHGRTMATLSATGQDGFHHHFDPFPAGFDYAPANDWPGTAKKLGDDVCAVMVELVQGEGGVLPLDREYVKDVADYCAAHDVLLIVDEVQTGIGRTGTLFAYQQFGIAPDIVTAAKGLGGGLPIGAVILGEKVAETLGAGDHATTFGGNPAVCAGARYVLDKLDGAALEAVVQKGAYMRRRLMDMRHVEGVDGLGLMLGIRLRGAAARDVVAAGLQNGVITLTAKDKLRLLPPLTIAQAEMDEGLDRLDKTLKEMA